MFQTSSVVWWEGGRQSDDNDNEMMISCLDYLFFGDTSIYHDYTAIIDFNGWDLNLNAFHIDDLNYQYSHHDYVRIGEQNIFEENKDDHNYNDCNGDYHQQIGKTKSDLFNYYHNDRNENGYGYIGNYIPSDDVLADVIRHYIVACVDK